MSLWVAGAALGGAFLSSRAQKKAAEGATAAQVEAGDKSIAESRRQFDKMQEVLAPFIQAGQGAVSGLGDLLGLSGPESARDAIIDIEASPEFGALTQQGEDAILANASATGGLRGGNTQGALAQFRPDLLSNLINQRFQRLAGVAQLGQGSAAGVGAGAIQTGQNISGILQNQGEAIGQGFIARGNQNARLFGDVGRFAGQALGGLFGGGGGGQATAGGF